jgi:hypothetical protein
MNDETRASLADAIEDAINSVHDMDVTHADYARAAAEAVLKLIGPKPLLWIKHPTRESYRSDTHLGCYRVRLVGATVTWDFDAAYKMFSRVAENIEAAQTAAQAHADAAHWANTRIGE